MVCRRGRPRSRETLVHSIGALVPNRVDVITVQFCHRGFEERKGQRGSQAASYL
jgi:hypothetical protein